MHGKNKVQTICRCAPCGCRSADHFSLSSDAVLFNCAGRGIGGAWAAYIVLLRKRRQSMSVRMICVKAPRFLRGLIRLFAGNKERGA